VLFLHGWSQSLSCWHGLVITDYLRVRGDRAIGAVNLVGAAVQLTADFAHIGPGFLDNAPVACDPDLPTSVGGLRRLVRAFTVEPMAEADRELLDLAHRASLTLS
jgi:non-heme chloroperoxidase